MGGSSAGRSRSLSAAAWAPVPLFLLATLALKLDEPRTAFEQPYLLLLLNFVFSLVASVLVIALLARTFVVRGRADLLLFGCGLSAWALAGLVAVATGLVAAGGVGNHVITIHNLCVWLAGAGQLAGAVLVARPGPLLRRTGLWLMVGHTVVVTLVGLVVVASVAGWTPPFFVPGRGGTLLRQVVVGSASAMFAAAAALVVWSRARRSPAPPEGREASSFESWYAAALALIAVGLLGVALQTVPADALGWVGRSAQFLSGVYFVVAAAAAVHQSRLWGAPLAQAAREAEERYRALFETMSEGFALHEILADDRGIPCDYRFLSVNPAFERLTGLAGADLVGRRVLEVLPSTESLWVERYGRVALTGEPARFESYAAALGRWYEVFAYRPAPGQFAVVFSDISARKEAEQAVRDALARADAGDRMLKALMDHVPEGITIADPAGKLVMVSRRGEELLGARHGGLSIEEVARQWSVFRPDGVTPMSPHELPLARALRGEVVQDVEVVQASARGEKLPLLCNAAPIRARDGNVVGGIVAWRDITERKRAEEALREGAERLRLAQSGAHVGIWDWDLQTGTLKWTPELERLYGWEEGTFPGTYAAFRERVHPDDRDEVERVRAAATRARRPFDFDFRVRPPGGETVWVNCKGGAVYDEAGQPRRLFGVNVDITERKRAEELARARLVEIEDIYRNAPVGLCVLDRDLRFLRINDRLAEINGIPAADHIGRRVRDLMPELADAVEPDMRLVLETGEPRLNIEILSQTPAQPGVERSWLEQWLPLKDAQGRVTGLSVVVEETTERRRAEEALRVLNAELEQRVAERTAELAGAAEKVRAERQRFLDVLETLPVMVTLIRPDFHVPFANRAYREAVGEARGRTCYENQFGRDTPCEECQTFTPLQTGRPHHWEWSPPGGRTLDIHNFPFTDADGSPMVLEMGIDITERRRAERELQAAHEELAARAEQLRRLTGELTLAEQRERRRMAKLLHDHLQQLLVGARFRTSVLSRAGDSRVARSAGEIETLLEEALAASRSLTAELSPPILHEGGLAAGLGWLARWMADKHGLSVELSVEEPPQPLVDDVKVLLFESVRELLFNAVKHARARTVALGLKPAEGGVLQVTVSDSGPGFDPAALRQAGEGGGLGLFSIRERLGLIGGRMEIDSTPGRGSRIRLVVPLGGTLAPPTPPALESPAPETEAGRRPARVPAAGARARIRVLLADDHAVVREGVARLLLGESDMEVVGQAADGHEAVRLARALRPDVVLMDVSMPGLDGVEATRAIHADLPDVRVVGLSMFEEADQAEAMRAAGAVDYVTKSGPATELVAAVRGRRGVRSGEEDAARR